MIRMVAEDIMNETFDFSNSICPKCGQKTLVYDKHEITEGNRYAVTYVRCGCGFNQIFPIRNWYTLIGDNWHEKEVKHDCFSDQYWNDYQFYETSEGDLGYFCMEWALKTDIDGKNRKRDAEDLIKELEQVIQILKFRIRSVEIPALKRFCPICHCVLIKKKEWDNNYPTFFCTNKECQLFDKLQRGDN